MVAIAAKTDSEPIVVQLSGVSWRFYEELLKGLGERRMFVTYDKGDLEIVSPLPAHEYHKGILNKLITFLCYARGIELVSYGSMTFKRKDLEKGVEPDDCFWIASEPLIRNKPELDIRKDPPPDLLIEIEQSRSVQKRMAIFAALGVPEVWTFDGDELKVHLLKRGFYKLSKASKSFPFLPMDEFAEFIRPAHGEAPSAVLKRFEAWAKEL